MLQTANEVYLRAPTGVLSINANILNDYLSKHLDFGEKTKILAIKQFKYGQSNPTYLLDLQPVASDIFRI